MDSIFQIVKYGLVGIQINGLEKDSSEYVSESNIIPTRRDYAYSQSVTLNVLWQVDSMGNKTIVNSDFVDHTISTVDTDSFTIPQDGLYMVSHVILPTLAWYTGSNAIDATYITSNYSTVFYYNAGSIYKLTPGGAATVEAISDFMNENFAVPATTTELTNTIIRTDQNTFIMYYIKMDYGRICEITFDASMFISKNEIKNEQKHNRDIISLFINTMQYNIDMNKIYDAQRYMERYLMSQQILTNPIENGSNY